MSSGQAMTGGNSPMGLTDPHLTTFSFLDQSDQYTEPSTYLQLTPENTMHTRMQSEVVEGEPDLEADSFPNFLRAFYHYHPASTITSDDGDEASVTVPINQGDVILVHSIQPNGWADGTLLASGARGWLPTNYCEAYDHHKMRNLLDSLTNVWEFIRGHEDDDPSVFMQQDYVRCMIAGVRVLLERTGCLTRDAPLVKNAILVRRTRRTILGELSGFVKAGKQLQDMCAMDITSETLFDLLDEVVLKAFRVVTKAVKFLDVWLQHTQGSEVPTESAPAHTPAVQKTIHSALGLESGVAKSTNGIPVAVPGGKGSRRSTSLAGPRSPEVPLSPRASLKPRPASLISQKRISASHRLSSTPKSPILRKGRFASERLLAAHDAFLGNLGVFLSLHSESRSPDELMRHTRQAKRGFRALMDVVNEIVSRDHRASRSVEDARDAFDSNLNALDRVATCTCAAADPTDDGVFLLDNQTPILEAATLCVRSAGDYVSEAKSVIERIGDFEIEDDISGLGITHVLEEAMAGPTASQLTPAASQLTPTALEDFELVEKPLPSPPCAPSPPSASEKPKAMLAPFSAAKTALGADHLAPSENSVPRLSSDTVRRSIAAVPESSSMDQKPHPLNLNIPLASPIVLQDFAGIDHYEHGSPEQADSRLGYIADTNSSSLSSFRVSQESLRSQASTQATTPEQSPMSENDERSPKDSFGNLSESRSNLVEDSEEAESELLTTTYAHELTFNKEGQVTGGSLPALVERLTMHDSTPDALFVNTFYLTFRMFCNPADFARCLADRFEYVGTAPAIAAPVRLRVYNVLKGWLEMHWRFESDGQALDIIADLARGPMICLPTASKKLLELTEQAKRNSLSGKESKVMSLQGKTNQIIGSTVDLKTPFPSPVVSKGQLNALKKCELKGGFCSILDFEPLELARQFTLIESKIFCQIKPEELLAQEWTKKTDSKAKHVKAMSTLSTDLANLVADTILQPEEAKKRAVILKQWVKIAKKCRELNNYDSLLAIVCSLNSSMVSRLKKTWDLVSPKTIARLEELRSIVDCSRNYANLRQLLQNHVAPCIPFVGIYLTDLTFIDVGNQTKRQLPRGMRTMSFAGAVDPQEGISVINFDKHVKTAKIIGDLQRFQIAYRLAPVPEMQEWMESQIRRVRTSEQANLQTFYRRSLLLEPRETPTQKASPELASHGSFSSVTSVGGSKEKENHSTREKFEMWTSLHFSSGSNKEKVIP